MVLADRANEYIDEKKPWELAKRAGQEAELHVVCSVGLNLFRLLTLYLKPVLPKVAADVERFLGVAPLRWQDAGSLLPAGHKITPYRHLMTRIEAGQVRRCSTATIRGARRAATPPSATPNTRFMRRRRREARPT